MDLRRFAGLRVMLAAGVFASMTTILADRAAAEGAGQALTPDRRIADFDTQKYIDVDEIEPGMRGYGLTVFQGTEPERFDIVVVAVMPNFGVKRSAILIRCQDERFEIAKGVQGVSGSPVFIKDRLVGAMAFGWPFGSEPLYGVTPIREMLQVRQSRQAPETIAHNRGGGTAPLDRAIYRNLMAEQLLDREHIRLLAESVGLARKEAPAGTGLTVLPTAITVNGFNPGALEYLQGWIPGLQFSQGLAGSNNGAGLSPRPRLARGASLTIPLIMGDMSSAVLGTVTEVIDDQVYAFGHPWNAIGGSLWPMATGRIHTFISRLNMSSKLGEPVEIVGAIRADEYGGIYGEVGGQVNMIPLQVDVEWAHLGAENSFNVEVADHERMSPLLSFLVVMNSLLYRGGFPLEHTLTYESVLEFDGVEPIRIKNVSSGRMADELGLDTLNVVGLLLNNPWQKVSLRRMEVRAVIDDQNRVCTLKFAQLSRRNFAPGDRVEAQITLEPLRAAEVTRSIGLDLPDDLPDGRYKIMIGASSDYMRQMQTALPHRFRAFDARDIQRILQERMCISRNGLYMMMTVPTKRGLAIDGETLPNLPASRATLLTDASRQRVTSTFAPFLSTQVPTDFVVRGRRTFEIEVRKEE